jgi:hypothetical protein
MKIVVSAKTGSKKPKVTELKHGHYQICVTAQPIDGKANDAIIKSLAKHLGVAPSCLTIIRGVAAKTKTIEISK